MHILEVITLIMVTDNIFFSGLHHSERAALPPSLIQTGSTGSSSSSVRDDESSLSGQSLPTSSLSDGELDDESCCSSSNDAVISSEAKDINDEITKSTSKEEDQASFLSLRVTYLIVTLVVMLADGLQGTLAM